MTPQPSQKPPPRGGDPWHAFSYLVAGVFLYGGLGWLADRWLGTSFLVVIGILLGAGLGIYMTIARFDALPRRQKEQK
ncbi:MAG TPA: AtpZ/AtpI family protein [Nocardioidaceae bacterium]|jgi:ATP synthase protein I|nr:AtpZ/AtpI family protein [Nocardioidaceae bacterium]